MALRTVTLFVVLASAATAVAPCVAQDAPPLPDLNKPLEQFTIGDIFPRVTDRSTRSVGESWVSSAADLERIAEERLVAVDTAIENKKAQIQTTKAELKTARKAKDFIREGTLKGTIESDEMVVRILEDVQEISSTQIDFADAWAEAGKAIQAYFTADEGFDAVREQQISKPDSADVIDNRMGSIHVELLRDYAAAMDRLGERFEELGSVVQKSADRRLRLLNRLEKGGHVRTTP